MPDYKNQDLNPQNGVGGTSYIYDQGASADGLRTAVSQKTRILTPHYGNNQSLHQMGVLSSFSIDMSRGVESVRGIGFGDKIAEQVPGVMDAVTGSMERALLNGANLWASTGYAAGIDGPMRSLAHQKWPFDIELQQAFSALSDADLGAANVGYGGQAGTFSGGAKQISYPQTTSSGSKGSPSYDPSSRGRTALLTILEACWFTSYGVNYAKDTSIIMENGAYSATDIHDFASVYGEFLATGNDPTIGQLGSMRFAESGYKIGPAGTGFSGGGTVSSFAQVTAQ